MHLQTQRKSSPPEKFDQEHNATVFTTATLLKVQPTLLITADSAHIGVRYNIEPVQPCVVYGATCASFIDRRLQDTEAQHEKNKKVS